MLKSNKEVISLKIKAYVAILCSHLTVLTALCTPIIRVAEVKMAAVGQAETDSYYLNIFDFARVNLNSFSTFLMLFLTVFYLFFIHFSNYLLQNVITKCLFFHYFIGV
jgi:hypothetical protein